MVSGLLLAVSQAFDNWAVLVAGSQGIWNYRHQSDVCAAYQLLVANGMPRDHIIVMAVDDVAWEEENPFPGELFNRPDGENVYEGCQIDYRGLEEVTPSVFKAVLTGDLSLTGGKPVLRSGPDSNVFIYFSDHGELGFLVFPDHEPMYADEFNHTLYLMH